MGGHLAGAQILDKRGHVIGLVRAQGEPVIAGAMAVDQLKRSVAFRRPRGDRHAPANHKAVAVLHQSVAHEGQLAFPAIALAVETRIRIGAAFMGLVGALLAVKVPLRVTPRRRIVTLASLGTERFRRRPGLDQRAVHREVIPAQKPLYLAVLDNTP